MTEENLSTKVRKWLDTQGYPLEMVVAAKLRKRGYDVLQASFYDDPESSKPREIDVVARVTDFVGLLQLFLFIECKKRSKPWVIFSSENVGLMRARAFSLMSEKAFDAMISDPERFLNLDWFRKDGHVGFGIAEAFSDRGDETFQAGMTATKAAIDKRIKDARRSESALSFYFPVVVRMEYCLSLSLIRLEIHSFNKSNQASYTFLSQSPDSPAPQSAS